MVKETCVIMESLIKILDVIQGEKSFFSFLFFYSPPVSPCHFLRAKFRCMSGIAHRLSGIALDV